MVQTVDREHSKGQWMVQVIHQSNGWYKRCIRNDLNVQLMVRAIY